MSRCATAQRRLVATCRRIMVSEWSQHYLRHEHINHSKRAHTVGPGAELGTTRVCDRRRPVELLEHDLPAVTQVGVEIETVPRAEGGACQHDLVDRTRPSIGGKAGCGEAAKAKLPGRTECGCADVD